MALYYIRSLTVDQSALTITSTPSSGLTVSLDVRNLSGYYTLTYKTTGSNMTGAALLDHQQVSDTITTYTISDADILALMPRRQIDTLTITAYATYSSSASSPTVGDPVSVSVMVNLDSSLAPTFSISSVAVSDVAGQYSIADKIIADGKTRVIANFTATYATGASFKRIVLTPSVGEGIDSTTSIVNLIKFNAIPMGLTSDTPYTIDYSLTDSRGFVTTGTYNPTPSLTCYAYASPMVNIIAYRVNAENDPDEDPEGAWLYYRLEGTCTEIGSPSANTIDTDPANTYIQVGSGTAYAINTDHWEQLNIDASATINAKITDTISYTTASYTVGTASFPIDLCDDSQGNVGGGFGTVASYGRYEFAYPAMGPGCIEFIAGTQAASTNAWTGVSRQKALREGMMILYYLPFAGTSTAATLTLTLADGTTTSALPVYLNSTTGMTTHFGQYAQILLIYHENFSVNGETKTGWWHDADRDTDTTSRLRNEYSAVKTYTVLYRYMVCFTKDEQYILPVNTHSAAGTTAINKTLTTESFDPFGQVYYYNISNSNTVVNADAVPGANLYTQYTIFDLRYSFNTAKSLTANRAVYLVCQPQSDGKVKLHTTPIRQLINLNNQVDGLVYKFLGYAYDSYRLLLLQDKPCYYFDGFKVTEWTPESWFTLFYDTSSPLQGGSGMSLDLTKYSRVRVHFMSYSSSGQFEIDLTNQVPHPAASGDEYSGTGVTSYYNSTNSRIETHICWVVIPSTKDSLTVEYMGYTYSGKAKEDRNNDANYYVYRIDARY